MYHKLQISPVEFYNYTVLYIKLGVPESLSQYCCSTPSFSRPWTLVSHGSFISLWSYSYHNDGLLVPVTQFKVPGESMGHLCSPGTAVQPQTMKCPTCLSHQGGSLISPALHLIFFCEHLMEASFLVFYQTLCSRILNNETVPVWVFSLGSVAEYSRFQINPHNF